MRHGLQRVCNARDEGPVSVGDACARTPWGAGGRAGASGRAGELALANATQWPLTIRVHAALGGPAQHSQVAQLRGRERVSGRHATLLGFAGLGLGGGGRAAEEACAVRGQRA